MYLVMLKFCWILKYISPSVSVTYSNLQLVQSWAIFVSTNSRNAVWVASCTLLCICWQSCLRITLNLPT